MINGGVKFFNKSQCLAVDGATISATSGSGSAEFALDRNQFTFWRSVGSNDGITEEIIVTFSEDKTIDRILLLDHNFKNFSVKYDLAGVWTNFASVQGIGGSLSGINETTNTLDSTYYEFTQVTTGAIQITCLSTQVANAQKYICQIIATNELGTLKGFPRIPAVSHSKNERALRALSGRLVNLKSDDSFQVQLSFETYPTDSTYSPDFDLIFSLFDRDENFLIWLCGGRQGSTYFRYQMRGFRLKDVYEVQTVGQLSPAYYGSVYTNPVNLTVDFSEAV